MATATARQLLSLDLNCYQQKLNLRLLDRLERGFRQWQRERRRAAESRRKTFLKQYPGARVYSDDAAIPDRDKPREVVIRELFEYLQLSVDRQRKLVEELDRRYDEFRCACEHAPTGRERRQLILDLARDLGARRRQLRGDARAFSRWFGDDAVIERYRRRRAQREQQIAFCLHRLGTLAARMFDAGTEADTVAELWGRLGLERILETTLQYSGDARVHVAALRSLRTAVRGLREGMAEQIITGQTLSTASRLALDTREDVWVQCEALSLLETISPTSLERVLRLRLTERGEGDDVFLRRRAVRLLGEHLPRQPALVDLLSVAAEDPSPFVRQALARAVCSAPIEAADYWMRHLAVEDSDPKVRSAALVEGIETVQRDELQLPFLHLLADVLCSESDAFVLRVAFHSAVEWIGRWSTRTPCSIAESAGGDRNCDSDQNAIVEDTYRAKVLPAIRRLQATAADVPTRRYAAQAGEQIWCCLDAGARTLRKSLEDVLASLPPGKSRRLPRRILRGYDRETIGRVLAVLARDDFGFDLERRWWGDRITRGPVFRFRFWRLLHEFRSPSPDKRQAFRHTIGRVSNATLRAPSAIMAELSETKVPGEPLVMPEEGGWRPYLPLVDDLISALGLRLFGSSVVRFYTSQGVTELTTPRGPLAKLIAHLRLTLRFSAYARLRNWKEETAVSPQAYLQAVKRLRFGVRFRPYTGRQRQPAADDSSVLRFFPAVFALFSLESLRQIQSLFLDYASYFTSVFENSLPQLVLFAAAVTGLFLGKHLYSNWTLRRARRRLPVSIGGWGTRGKSGTERLKAALLSALGYGVFSKSTGCEAMFLHGRPFEQLHELLLYRPYDKATIWEHRNVMRMASRLQASAFLWECMGLTPAYVDVLQRQWTQDDLATITNTYPDHEELQGPAGLNVAQVIAGFIPPAAGLITSEQQMRPLLRWTCRRLNSDFKAVGWLESGLLTADVLARFPYMEHPENIALVAALAEELGCDPDFALKEMADRLVPDLGVLKTYPPAKLRTRLLEFTNGMSANERFGCLANWTRMEFDGHNPATEPGVWITTVVNNRADRVARSRVFAEILVHDVRVDRHFLIGGNIKGLLGFVWQAWEKYAENLSLWSTDREDPTAGALAALAAAAERFRQPTGEKQVRETLRAMLAVVPRKVAKLPDGFQLPQLHALWSAAEELAEKLEAAGLDPVFVRAITGHLGAQLDALRTYQALAERIRSAAPDERRLLDNEFRDLARSWFERKLVVIDDYHASGEQIIHRICEETPPGFRNRIMGMQNIKGTGLDFVYRWQAWEKCHDACRTLRSRNPLTARRALQDLAEFQDFGLLGEEHLQATIDEVRNSTLAQREEFRAELDIVEANLKRSVQNIKSKLTASAGRGGILAHLLGKIEEFLDVSDAVRRRKRADRIYRDLEDERISGPRAALELRALNRRQKGGWLRRMFRRARPQEVPPRPIRPEPEPVPSKAALPITAPPQASPETAGELSAHGTESRDS